MTFPEKLRLLLDKNPDLRQSAVAESIGVHRNRISEWLKANGSPSARQALGLSRVFGVSMEFLIDDEMEEPPTERGLAAEERIVLQAYRESKLSVTDAVVRLKTEMRESVRAAK